LWRSDLCKKPRVPRESPRKFRLGSGDKAPAHANGVASFHGARALGKQVLYRLVQPMTEAFPALVDGIDARKGQAVAFSCIVPARRKKGHPKVA
jgi:hypothetical protein